MLTLWITFSWWRLLAKRTCPQVVSNFPRMFQPWNTTSTSWNVGSDAHSLHIFSRLPAQLLPSSLLNPSSCNQLSSSPFPFSKSCRHLPHPWSWPQLEITRSATLCPYIVRWRLLRAYDSVRTQGCVDDLVRSSFLPRSHSIYIYIVYCTFKDRNSYIPALYE